MNCICEHANAPYFSETFQKREDEEIDYGEKHDFKEKTNIVPFLWKRDGICAFIKMRGENI